VVIGAVLAELRGMVVDEKGARQWCRILRCGSSVEDEWARRLGKRKVAIKAGTR
jgi:hypothetical protein